MNIRVISVGVVLLDACSSFSDLSKPNSPTNGRAVRGLGEPAVPRTNVLRLGDLW